MRKFAFICMLAVLAMALAAPAVFACDGAKKAEKASVTTANATSNDATVTKVGASCGSKTDATKAGASCGTKADGATKAGASCTAAEKAACMGKAGTTTASATLPNGHPSLPIAEAVKCGSAMVAFVNVDKMTCNGCVTAINKAIGSMDGVCAVETSLDKKMATIVFHPEKVKTEDLTGTITKAGFVASMKQDCSAEMKAIFGASAGDDVCKTKCANSSACIKKDTKESSES